jgi:hypothetical protein
MVNPDFRVEHSVDLRPDYAELIRRETELKGTPPKDFEKLQSVYNWTLDTMQPDESVAELN